MSRRVTFVTRVGCTLCDEAEPVVRSWAQRLGIEMEMVDVDAAGLADRLGDMVPVVLGPDDDVVVWGRIRQARLALGMLGVRFGGRSETPPTDASGS